MKSYKKKPATYKNSKIFKEISLWNFYFIENEIIEPLSPTGWDKLSHFLRIFHTILILIFNINRLSITLRNDQKVSANFSATSGTSTTGGSRRSAAPAVPGRATVAARTSAGIIEVSFFVLPIATSFLDLTPKIRTGLT